MVCYDWPVGGIRSELCGDSGCESWCFMLSQWLGIMVYYGEQLFVNHSVLCCAIMLCYSEPVIVNHVVLF